jgi:hypothetical protein
MTKGNWVSGLNAWLGQTAYRVGEKNMAESMRWTKDRGRNTDESKWKRKKEIKTGNDFLAAKI